MNEELIRLLDKYYQGETSEEEEKLLKTGILGGEDQILEKEIFSFFAKESELPEDLDNQVFAKVEKQTGKRNLRMMIYSISSMAAALALILTLYTGYRTGQKNNRDFRMIEQALYRVSETLQPEPEEPEMLVLWVDNNVEIIVN